CGEDGRSRRGGHEPAARGARRRGQDARGFVLSARRVSPRSAAAARASERHSTARGFLAWTAARDVAERTPLELLFIRASVASQIRLAWERPPTLRRARERGDLRRRRQDRCP